MDENIDTKYSKAFSEVFCVFENLTEELYSLIPNSFINLVKENMDKDYKVTKEDLNKNGMMVETQTILGLVYRDYFCSDELKNKYLELDKQALKFEEKKYEIKFDNDKIDEQNTETKKESENKELIVYEEESFIKRIIKKIKDFFKIK